AKYNHLGPNGEISPGKNGKTPHFIDRENNHPAIVERSLFDRVQRLLAERQRRRYVRKTAYAFSGLLRCGHCGERMVGWRKSPTGAHSYPLYHCSSYHLAGKSVCYCNAIREDRLLSCVLRKLRGFWTVPGNLERLTEAIRQEFKGTDEGEEPLLR